VHRAVRNLSSVRLASVNRFGKLRWFRVSVKNGRGDEIFSGTHGVRFEKHSPQRGERDEVEGTMGCGGWLW